MVGRVFDTAIIKIKTVNVDVCFHKPLNTETAVRRSRTRFAEATTGGSASIIAKNGETVKQTLFLFYLKCLGKPFSQSTLNAAGMKQKANGQNQSSAWKAPH